VPGTLVGTTEIGKARQRKLNRLEENIRASPTSS
jgi:hypothetical protein